MKSRFAKQMVLFALLAYLVFLCLNGVIFFLSHLPPAVVHLDWFIRRLGGISRVFTWPRRLLRHLWPGESTPTALNYGLAALNWLLWGTVLAGWRAFRERTKA